MRNAVFMVVFAVCSAGVVAAQATAPPAARAITLRQAEREALEHHPLIKASEYAAQAADETTREVRSAYRPTASGAVTGAGAGSAGTRIAAGALNNPTILDRFAAGASVSQLVTDFGRTHDLVQSSSLLAQSRQQDVDARRADVLLDADRAYFEVLRAKAVLRVAQETVDTRKTVADQVEALANSNLKSGLDVSFAKVNLGEAQLLLVQAQDDLQAAYASLSAALGDSATTVYAVAEEPQPPAPPADSAALVADALRNRPDVAAERLAGQAAMKFAQAERALWMPSVSFVGAAGWSPYHESGIIDRYSAGGVNVTIPLTNGGLYNARHAEALFKAQAQQEISRELENTVTRDVTVAWLATRTAFQRMDLTNQLLAQASDALDLAQARYTLGITSIVELTQAQLYKTSAEIAQASARYEYQTRNAALRYQTGDLR